MTRKSILALVSLLLSVLVLFSNAQEQDYFAIQAGYVFTAFTQDEQALHVYTSNNGADFAPLKAEADERVYIPQEGILRDPSVIKHVDGMYYIVYTTGWESQMFAIAKSSDLNTWALVANVSTVSGLMIPVNSWAPEFFIDPQTGTTNVIISLSPGNWHPFTPYIYTAKDNDTLLTWSQTPVAMTGIPTTGLGYIDAFVVYQGDQYHVFAKAETPGKKHIEHAVAPTLSGPYVFVQTGDFAGWGEAEGPCVVQVNDNWRMYADGFSTGKYIYSDSPDLFHWTVPRELPDGLSGIVRHGTVVKV